LARLSCLKPVMGYSAAMSSENVEIVRKVFEAWDVGGVAAAMQFLDSDAEMQLDPVVLDEGVLRGREAIGAYLTSVVEQLWDAFGVECDNYESVGPRHVVVDVRMSGRGGESDAPVEQRFVEAFELRGGRVVWLGVYPDRATALEAVELRE
jgi:ketosteroid isomerase-like protein